jgi:hypothetical protein
VAQGTEPSRNSLGADVRHYFGCAWELLRIGACSIKNSISASVMPLCAKSVLSSSSDKKSEVRMNGPVVPCAVIRKMKNCSGLIPLTLATPHFLFGIVS